jgi:hypothetical protein
MTGQLLFFTLLGPIRTGQSPDPETVGSVPLKETSKAKFTVKIYNAQVYPTWFEKQGIDSDFFGIVIITL